MKTSKNLVSSKLQATNTKQITNFNAKGSKDLLGICNLVFVWLLLFVTWSFQCGGAL